MQQKGVEIHGSDKISAVGTRLTNTGKRRYSFQTESPKRLKIHFKEASRYVHFLTAFLKESELNRALHGQ